MTLVSDPLESTLGLIKPDAVRKGYEDQIFETILQAGLLAPSKPLTLASR